jgi:hypothetical protein
MSDFDTFDEPPAQDHSRVTNVAGLSEGAKAFIRQFVPADDDTGCIATFETVQEFKPFKSKELQLKAEAEGRIPGPECEIYEPVTYIRINIRGSNLREVHRPIREEDKRRFPYAWQEYQKGEKAASRGTPLSKLAGLDASLIRHYHALSVYTIEDLALVSDLNLQNLGTGAREFRRAAQEFIESRRPTEDPALRETVVKQGEQLAQAMALLEKLSEENARLKARKKPGPKPKVTSEG